MPPYTIRSVQPADTSRVRQIVSSVLAEYGLSLDAEGTDRDLADLTASYHDRGGVLRVIVDSGGSTLGCRGLYRLTAQDAEIRKMYLLPEARGHGLGHRPPRGRGPARSRQPTVFVHSDLHGSS